MKFTAKKSALFTALFSLLFISCSLVTPYEKSTSIEIRLPNASARSVYGDNGFTSFLSVDGKFDRTRIDEYVITLKSSSGKTITETAPKEKSSILIEDIEAGEWEVNFTAYAVDESDSGTVKTIIARNRESIKTTVKGGETATVNITAQLIKYVNETNPFVSGTPSEISMNVRSRGYQFVLNDSYTLSVSELVSFSVTEGEDVVKVTKDGLVVPVKAGTAEICSKRLQDGQYSNNYTVNVLPVVRVNCYVNDANISSKYSPITEIIADNGDTLETALMNFPIGTIASSEGLTCGWYSDEACTERLSSLGGKVDLYDIYNSADKNSNFVDVNIYQGERRSVGNIEELKTALLDNGSGDILMTFTNTLTENLVLSITKDITLYGATSACGFNGDDNYHIIITGDSTHSLELNNLTFQKGYAGQNGKGGAIQATDIKGLTIKNCNFSYNKVYATREDIGGKGGSIYLQGCSGVSVADCIFTQNVETACCAEGGFMYIDTECTSVNISNSTFTGAFANHGGALGLRVSATVEGCTFRNNQGHYRGGAINAGSNSSIKVNNCIFDGNMNAEGTAPDLYTCGATITATGCKDGDGNDIGYSTCSSDGSGGITIK